MKRKHKKAKIVLITLGSLIIITSVTVLGLFAYSWNYKIPVQAEKIEPTGTNLISTQNRSLYDKNGNIIKLNGINAGNILLQEGWMSPFDLEPKKDKNGNLIKDKDGNLSYDEFSEEMFLDALNKNENLKDHQEELKEYYYKSFFDEEDFKIIKNDLGLNTIRLPFYWRNILNDDFTRKEESVAFNYLNWFLENCKKNDLYCILDLHGAPGSQNGYEHSGLIVDKPGFWGNETYENAVLDLWDYVSSYYSTTRSDLAPTIASYDILNEPQTSKQLGSTTKVCWDYFDKVYQVIRKNNDNHVITMEGCWDFSTLPDPKKYSWENVMYEYHHYNWQNNIVTMDMFKMYHMMRNIGKDYNVPILIGEFTYFEDRNAWNFALNEWYDKYNYNWTVWNYKTTVTGWWTSSWGVYTVNLNLDTSKEETKTNVLTCTIEEFKAACDKAKTSNCQTGTLKEILIEYKNSKSN